MILSIRSSFMGWWVGVDDSEQAQMNDDDEAARRRQVWECATHYGMFRFFHTFKHIETYQ